VKYHCWALEWQRHDKMAPSSFIVSTERDADDVYDGDFCKEEDLLLSKENTKRENGIKIQTVKGLVKGANDIVKTFA
jgi:hypothetical protein